MVQVHARESGDAVHGRRKPHAPSGMRTGAACGKTRRRLLGKRPRTNRARKPRSPSSRKRRFLRKAADVLEPRQRELPGRAFLGKVEVRDDDDELVHERVF